jgi:hypothetical protein
MATWQFWTLFTVLVLMLVAASAIHDAVKGLWTKLHELQQAIRSFPCLDYREDIEALGRRLQRIENAIHAQRPDYDPD